MLNVQVQLRYSLVEHFLIGKMVAEQLCTICNIIGCRILLIYTRAAIWSCKNTTDDCLIKMMTL